MNSTRNNFFVKFPEVFQTAAAASDNHQIDRQLFCASADFIDPTRNLARCALALHAYRTNQDAKPRATAPQNIEHVLKRRAGGRSYQRNLSGKPRQFSFSSGI